MNPDDPSPRSADDALFRAQHAWDDWTDEDIAMELRPWPALDTSDAPESEST